MCDVLKFSSDIVGTEIWCLDILQANIENWIYKMGAGKFWFERFMC
jgi:hypothetical protein